MQSRSHETGKVWKPIEELINSTISLLNHLLLAYYISILAGQVEVFAGACWTSLITLSSTTSL